MSGRVASVRACYLAGVAGLVVALLACSSPEFDADRESEEVVAALDAAGLEICDRETTDLDLAGGVGGIAIEVAVGPCDADDDRTGVVVVEEFESEDARDAAIRNAFLQNRQRPFVSPFVHGPFVVRLAAGADDAVLDRYETAIATLEDQQ